jgi:hypothetical protein
MALPRGSPQLYCEVTPTQLRAHSAALLQIQSPTQPWTIRTLILCMQIDLPHGSPQLSYGAITWTNTLKLDRI